MRLIFCIAICLIPVSIIEAQGNTQVETINAEPFIDEELYYPSDLAVVDNWLFVKDILKSTGEYGLKVYNTDTGEKVYEFVRPGRGPGEYLSFDIRKGPNNNQLEIMGSKTRKNDIYDVNCLKKQPPPVKSHTCIDKTTSNMSSKEAIILDTKFVFNTGAKEDGVLFLSKGNKVINQLDNIPQNISTIYNNPLAAAMSMGGYLVSNKDRTKIAFFAEYYDKFIFFEYNTSLKSVTTTFSNDPSYLPKFDVEYLGQSLAMTPTDNTKFAFRTPVSGNKHIFVLYSGKTNSDVDVSETVEWRAFTNKIKIFNWNGNQIKEIKLNFQVSMIAVDSKETILFGGHFNKNGESSIIKAHLN